jgi:hypothetical protein
MIYLFFLSSLIGLFYGGPYHPIYITVGKEPVSKDPVEINCIPPRLNMWYRVVCIDGIGILLVIFLGGINETFDLFISKFFISL